MDVNVVKQCLDIFIKLKNIIGGQNRIAEKQHQQALC